MAVAISMCLLRAAAPALEKVGWVGGLQIGRVLSGLKGHLLGPFPASAAPEPPAWPLSRGDQLPHALESAEKWRRKTGVGSSFSRCKGPGLSERPSGWGGAGV